MLRLFVFSLTLFSAVSVCSADIVNIISGGPNSNVETIMQVVLTVDDGTGARQVIQNAPATGATQEANSAILQSITTANTTIGAVKPAVPRVTNNTFPASAPGIQVLGNGTAVGVSDTDFIPKLEQMHSNGDLMNYIRVDGGDFEPQWDIQYSSPIDDNDYLIVEERDGNTTFTVEALDINGDLIAGSNLLSFSGASYQWSIGLANSADPNSSQPQVLSVIDFDLFNAGTQVYGFRINDTGNADFKFFVASAVPEPGSATLVLFLALAPLWRRHKKSVA